MFDIYTQNIIDHYKNPRNYGDIKNPSTTSKMENLTCGDSMEVFVLIENEKICDLKFTGNGCALSQSAMSILSEKVIGKNISEVKNIKKNDIVKMLGISVGKRRLKCVSLGISTLHKAIAKFDNV